MYREFNTDDRRYFGASWQDCAVSNRVWTVIIPFHNEENYIADTIASIAAQTMSCDLVLVDNGSTDASAAVARAAAQAHGLDHVLVHEARRGKVAALKAGLKLVSTRFVATCDADTLYPAHYLASAADLLAQPGCAVAGAYFVSRDWTLKDQRKASRRVRRAARQMPGQCHTGGAGQAFDTASLRRAGGFDPDRWNFVLEDHEIIHRVLKYGRMAYSNALWCMPSTRDRRRVSTRWTLVERLVYHTTVTWRGDWFFGRFLGPRLERRRLTSEGLRETATMYRRVGDAPACPVLG